MGVPASVSVINFLGSKPSLAAARLRFPAVIVFAFNDPRVEIRAPILIIVPPVMPNIFVAANANGAEELINSFAMNDYADDINKQEKPRVVSCMFELCGVASFCCKLLDFYLQGLCELFFSAFLFSRPVVSSASMCH